MIKIERTALLPRSAEFMFTLINDVAAYPQYMDGCEAVEIIEQTDESMTARLFIRKAGVRQSFTTRNRLFHPERISLELVDGPFSKFAGEWQLKQLADDACKVGLNLEFLINSRLAGKALEKLFTSVGDELVDAVCRRAALTEE